MKKNTETQYEFVNNPYTVFIEKSLIKENKLREHLNLSRTTYWRKKSDPKTFNIAELEIISQFTKSDFNELVKVIRSCPKLDPQK